MTMLKITDSLTRTHASRRLSKTNHRNSCFALNTHLVKEVEKLSKGNPVFNFVVSVSLLSYLLGIPLLCLWLLKRKLKQNMRFLGWFMLICGSLIFLINFIQQARIHYVNPTTPLFGFLIIGLPTAIMAYTGWKLTKR